MQPSYISRHKARTIYGISVSRLNAAIKSGEIGVRYTGTRTAKVCQADIERLIQTPPNATPA